MIPVILFTLSLLFALFVVWYCFQDSAHFNNQSRLEALRRRYIQIPLRIRLARLAAAGASVEYIAMIREFQDFYLPVCVAR